jgi:hypothetical protein
MFRLTSSVAKHCKSRSEHDENGETEAEKGRRRSGDSAALATGALPTCQRVSHEEIVIEIKSADQNQLGYMLVVYIAQT